MEEGIRKGRQRIGKKAGWEGDKAKGDQVRSGGGEERYEKTDSVRNLRPSVPALSFHLCHAERSF